MKKFLYLLIYSVLFLLLSIGVTVVSDLFAFSSAWYPLIIAFALLIITTVFSRVSQNR